MRKKPKYGYCAVTADFLHIGHLRMLKFCASRCQRLIVGIMSDECVKKYKGAKPIMNQEQRREIIDYLICTYKTLLQDSFEFPHDVLRMKEFYGKDFVIFDNAVHNRSGADVLVPYMEGISSTRFKKEYMS